MCGIVGYVGDKRAAPLILEMLSNLEYRGYDSAGIATISSGLHLEKEKGGVADLKAETLPGSTAIGHTRWATHGPPSKANAHPHINTDGSIAVVHNGIIENYNELKAELSHIEFRSETDTEVLAHLIDAAYKGNLFEAVKLALSKVKGSFALLVVSDKHEGEIIIARRHSPLAVGLGNGEIFLASDVPAFLAHTKKAIFLEDDEIGRVTKKGLELFTLSGEKVNREPMTLEWSSEAAEKGGYEHFMLKEIHEQPETIHKTLSALPKSVDFGKNLYIIACGTSYNAGMLSIPYLSQLGVRAQMIVASEFQEFAPIIDEDSTVLAISQSGETADTLSAIKLAKEKGAKVIALTNVVGSSIARAADDAIYTRCGPEIGVAATKTFSSQAAALIALSHGLSFDSKRLADVLEKIKPQVKRAVALIKDAKDVYFLGRGQGYALSLEAALKLKEIGYIHAEGFAGGELKHGPLALIEDGTWVVALGGFHPFKMLGSIMEVKARGAKVISIAPEGDTKFQNLCEATIDMPRDLGAAAPLFYALPLQLLSYYTGVEKGINVDKPRNLAKSVTVE